MISCDRSREGVSLVEVLLVACLFGIVLAAIAGFASSQSRLLARMHDRTRAQAVVRTASLVLDTELRRLDPGDITTVDADSVRLRAVRGGGVVCAAEGSALFVRYRGLRRPNPDKDSVIVVRDNATAGRVHPLLGVARDDRCGGTLRLDTDTDAAPGWALVFETGAYHMSGHALRYRRGAGGRQALTEGLLEDGAFQTGSGFLQLEVSFDRDSLPHLDTTRLSTLRLPVPGMRP